MKKVEVYFPENKTYNQYEFLKEKVYALRDEPKGFIQRWITRGCKIVEDSKDVCPDPRYKIDVAKKAVKKVVEKVTPKIVTKSVTKKKTVNKTATKENLEVKHVAVQKQEI